MPRTAHRHAPHWRLAIPTATHSSVCRIALDEVKHFVDPPVQRPASVIGTQRCELALSLGREEQGHR